MNGENNLFRQNLIFSKIITGFYFYYTYNNNPKLLFKFNYK